MIIHWNFEGSAMQVGVRGIHCEAPTTTPGDLQDVQRTDEVDARGRNSQMEPGVRVRVQQSNAPRASLG